MHINYNKIRTHETIKTFLGKQKQFQLKNDNYIVTLVS